MHKCYIWRVNKMLWQNIALPKMVYKLYFDLYFADRHVRVRSEFSEVCPKFKLYTHYRV